LWTTAKLGVKKVKKMLGLRKGAESTEKALIDTKGRVVVPELDPMAAATQLRMHTEGLDETLRKLGESQMISQEDLQYEFSI
jgi:hypothetical protein